MKNISYKMGPLLKCTMKYKAGDLSKILASVSPKSIHHLDESNVKGQLDKQLGSGKKKKLEKNDKSNEVGTGIDSDKVIKKRRKSKEKKSTSPNIGQKEITNDDGPAKKKSKHELVMKDVENSSDKDIKKKKKKKKKNRKSVGLYKRLESKKKDKGKTLKEHQSENEEHKIKDSDKVESNELQSVNEDSNSDASFSLNSDDNDNSDTDSKTVENKNDNSSNDDDSDGGKEVDDEVSDSDDDSEDDLSYKDSSMVPFDEDSESSDDSDSEVIAANKKRAKNDWKAEGFCPPEGVIHESLQKKVEKRKTDSDDGKKDPSPVKKLKVNEEGKDKGTRPRKDRVAKAENNRSIFVGNLSVKTTKKQLVNLFKRFGPVESTRFRNVPVNDPKLPKRVIAIRKDFHPKRNTFNAYVCFKSEESAKEALTMNGTEVDGLHIRVDKAGRKTQKDPKKSVFIGNLPLDIEEESVREHFSDCGEIENVRIVRDRKTCLGKGFGFLTFKDNDGVSFALKLNESKLKGRKLRLESCVGEKKSANSPAGQKKPTSDKSKKIGKRHKTPSNVVKNPFKGEKVQQEKTKLVQNKQNKAQKSQKQNFLEKDIEKILKEGKTDVNTTPKHKKFGDGSFREQKGGQFGKESSKGIRKFEKKPLNSNTSFEKKGEHFVKKQGFHKKGFERTPDRSGPGISTTVKKGTHIKFD